ncbi:Aspartic proteinase CDR1 [Linum perenne]
MVLLCFTANSEAVAGGGFSVQLIHRDSPVSPFYNPHLSPSQRLGNALKRSVNRLHHFTSTNTNTILSAQSQVTPDNGEYLMNISLGTPPVQILAIADTGSDNIWTQCKPCTNCFVQNAPLFDPASSSTYKTVPCSSKVCSSFQNEGAFCIEKDTICHFDAEYGSGAQTNGDLALETLTLGSTDGQQVSFPKTLVGCSHNNIGKFPPNGSGIVGLGGGSASLVTQIEPSIGYKFSYCLAKFEEDKLTSTMNFGENAVVSGEDVVSTPLFSVSKIPAYYILQLDGVSVGEKRIPYQESGVSSGGKGNIMIDSGSALTWFSQKFFSQLMEAIDSQIVGGKKAEDPNGYLSHCYLAPAGSSLNSPRVTMHFEGADVKLSPSNLFIQASNTVTCLAFHGNGSIYGNVAQQNFLIGYDIQKKTVSFKHTDSVLIHSFTIPMVILCFITNSEAAAGGGFSVQLIHRDSPISPFYNPHLSPSQRLRNALKRSINRLHHFSSTTTNTILSAQSQVTPNNGDYLMDISLGTPPVHILAIADTGSDIIWTQCKPCPTCYVQNAPLFDPASSSTYKTVPCSSKACSSLQNEGAFCVENDPVCHYQVGYGDGQSHTEGDLALEMLTLGSTDGKRIPFPKTLFGCGHDNSGTFSPNGSGIVGLGGGSASLVTQIGSSIGYKFSYCLVKLGEDKLTSTMNFGENAVVSGGGVVSTPLISHPTEPTFYFLNLVGISVGEKKIPLQTGSSLKGNIIIDSGTTLTMLPTKFFSQLSNAVESQIVGGKKAEDPQGDLSLCYVGSSLKVPRITVHFQGADVELPPSNVFIQVSDTVTCLAFQGSDNGSIYGNVAQQNFLIGYDIQKRTVSFKPTDCAHNN